MINTLSLFSGAGGLDIGFHQAGFNIVGCIELDVDSCKTLELNRTAYLAPGCVIYNNDIKALEPKKIHKQIGDIDFMIGGPPCQSFSAAGRRAGGVTGINDSRGSLFWYYCQFLKEFTPKGFLFENVRGILQANNNKDWETIKQSFAELGYSLYYKVLDAADYGVPQHRERVILVGTRTNEFLFPRPTYGIDSQSGIPHITAGDVLLDLIDPNEVVPPYGGLYGDLLPDIPPGMNYLFYTEKMNHPQPKFAWRSKFSDFLYKLDPKSPSRTLIASQGRYGGPFHWLNRKLTVPELKRIQSFPDDYKIYGGYNSAAKQIGNSVAPVFAFHLAKTVSFQIFGISKNKVELITSQFQFSFDKRKGKKAKLTQGKVKKNVSVGQLGLFQESVLFEDNFTDLHLKNAFQLDGPFDSVIDLVNGELRIGLVKREYKAGAKKIFLELSFYQPVTQVFNKIKADIVSDNLFDIKYLWDAIHESIGRLSSYTSLNPLYGHFTEPYPKFTLSTIVEESKNSRFGKLLKQLSNFEFLSKQHSVEILNQFKEKSQHYSDFVKQLRENRFDIRTHETNRAIPRGKFKFCYPFTLYSNQRTFAPWIDIGKHKTSDVKIISNKGKIHIHELNSK